MKLNLNSIEWSINHLLKFYNSDFFPKLFEYEAIKNNWEEVKNYIGNLELENYYPKSPFSCLAPKPNGTFRVVHLLDPLDSIILTALTYEICNKIEEYRIPKDENIACSYRIFPDLNGSFFSHETNDWNTFRNKTDELCNKYKNGYILITDITDYYNQIYIHRIRNIISEAGHGDYDEHAKVIENFFLNLNKKTSKGIPVGPASSIIYSEAIMADIDKKILNYTRDFIRYVDDIRIFFKSKEEAFFCLHELTQYIHSSHRLVFSGEKTNILQVEVFKEKYYRDEQREEEIRTMNKVEEKAQDVYNDILSNFSPYSYEVPDIEYEDILNEIYENEKFSILCQTYYEIIKENLEKEFPDYVLLRHILKRSAYYRIRTPYKLLLMNYEKMVPIMREFVIYLNKSSNENSVNENINEINQLFDWHYYKTIPYINIWLSSLFQNNIFKDITVNENNILHIRDKAFYAILKQNIIWAKELKEKIDILGPWDRRSVINSSQLLSKDERIHWLDFFLSSDNVIEKSIAKYIKDF